jgi:hypothetical protein
VLGQECGTAYSFEFNNALFKLKFSRQRGVAVGTRNYCKERPISGHLNFFLCFYARATFESEVTDSGLPPTGSCGRPYLARVSFRQSHHS